MFLLFIRDLHVVRVVSDGLEVQILEDVPEFDLLYFVGPELKR